MIPLSKKSVIKRRNTVANTLQAAIDGLALILVTGGLVWNQFGIITAQYAIMLLLLLGSLAVFFDRYGIYRLNVSFTVKVVTLIKAWTLSLLVLVVIAFASKQGEYFSRLLIAEVYIIGCSVHILLHLAFYYLQKSWLKHGTERENALILGQGELASYLAMKINSNPWMGQKVVGAVTGAVTMDKIAGEEKCEPQEGELQTLGDIGCLSEIIKKFQVSTVYIVTSLESTKLLEDVYFTLLDNHIAVHWVPDIFSLRLVNHNVNEISGIPVLTLSETPLTGTWLIAKLLEDKILSSVILLLISPVLLLTAIAVKLDSPGPVFFRQERAGWNGKTFQIWKFRSMRVHGPEGGVVKQAGKGDPRITKVGALLRRTSLDEFPQLLNVLAGDMSLVGPRPHALQHDQEYSQRLTDYFARHHIKPGITGLAQVRGFRGETTDVSQMAQRVESDIEYINNWSLWLDFTILLRTTATLTGKHAY
jgi:putative colanic acid biosynthesis UDP-glucose lipid carrier transferase